MLGDLIFHCPDHASWRRFSNPIAIITARSIDEVLPALRQVEAAVRTQQLYAAGCLAYEAAPAFDPALRVRTAVPDLPLLWMGLYRTADSIELPPSDRAAYSIGTWQPTVTWNEYERAINTIKEHIAAGRTYQVNYTYRLRTPFAGDSWTFFLHLARKQSNYAAYLDLDRWIICSASPELFFQLNAGTVISKPMKGTAPRGKTLAEDRARMEWLQRSDKNCAENVMIVDMIRNDLGRIAQIGSVQVSRLFEVERYPTVLQMTSTVTAQTEAAFTDLMRALFPCASITGAPKVSTMKIIADLESTPRGVYTGAIGYFTPDCSAQFNVAIRTVTIDRETGSAEYGVGGGIVWDSDAADEYRECEIKTRVLTSPPLEFDLLEALLWAPVTDGTSTEGYFLLDRHVARLKDSAEYFGIPFDAAALHDRLAISSAALPREEHKVRVMLSRQGQIAVTATPLAQIARAPVQHVALARNPVDASDTFLYHKTSRRAVYDAALVAARAERSHCDDVILWNSDGQLTESTTANVVIEWDGALITPPVSCGLLAGTFRGELLAQQQLIERVITTEMLRTARRMYLINSVRKWMPAILID